MTEVALHDPHVVQRHDTLSDLAQRSGLSVGELCRINGIKNPNLLTIGQVMYLSRASAFGVQVQFLDALRWPVANLNYRVLFDGKTLNGTTGPNGAVPEFVTASVSSTVAVWIKNLTGQWEHLCSTRSGLGRKCITLVSPYVVVPATTESHPHGAPTEAEDLAAGSAAAPARPRRGGTPGKNNPAVTVKHRKAKQGQSVIEIGIDLPQTLLDYFEHYTREMIAKKDWQDSAKYLICEPEVLKAIARVESGRAAFWRLNSLDGRHIPAIRYERHKFRGHTQGRYDHDHPDLSGRPLSPSSHAPEADQYDPDSRSYLRLVNAYRLDPDAALMSCSWGKFQILGDEWKTCVALSLKDFMERMCTSEKTQLELLRGFIRKKAGGKLWAAVKAKDWPRIALYYNGPEYAKGHYDKKLEAAYRYFKENPDA